MGRVTRRLVLGGGATLLGAAGLSALGCGRRAAAMAWRPERLQVARATLPNPEALGAALRAQIGAGGVAAAIGTVPGLVRAMAEPCPAQRAAGIDALVQAEHRRGEVIVLARWVVARSEALIAAAT